MFSISAPGQGKVQLRITAVGYKTVDSIITPAQQLIEFSMQTLDLNLREVEVNFVRKNASSNTSIIFDRQAIEQVQAFSITDILNNLPGKKIVPLDLQGPTNLTLRGNVDGAAERNNAMGIGIVVDGIVQTNNANMQSRNIGTFGVGGGVLNDSRNNRQYDVTFGGIDLRDIPADNIESIEVIQGIAPVKYGDMTDGAVIINRQAGGTPYQFSARFNGGSTNTSLSKGFVLNKKAGAINVNLNYLLSNNDPRDKMKSYSRLNGGVMWTSYFAKGLKNNFSIDLSEKFDNAKTDPDDDRLRRTYSKARSVRVGNRTSYTFEHSYLKSINLTIGFDRSYSESYADYYLNGSPKGMGGKDTTGTYEGFYIPGTYTAVDHIIGRPININGGLDLLSGFSTGNIKHAVSLGLSFSRSSNAGQGVLADPNRPRLPNSQNRNERPYNFELVPALVNTGAYVEDRFKLSLFGKTLNTSAGLRLDFQNGYASLQPRVNTNLDLGRGIRINAAYGIATKAPSLAYRYPGPTYIDLPLIDYYTGDVRNSLYLLHTWRHVPDNSNLKPGRSQQAELGVLLNKPFFTTSITAYHKINTRGFTTQSMYHPLTVALYNAVPNPQGKPGYVPAGRDSIWPGLQISEVGNLVDSKNSGVEWLVSTKKIDVIQTSLSFNTVFGYSTYRNAGERASVSNEIFIREGRKAWYAIYEANSFDKWSLVSRINTNTHIPRLGLVVSALIDMTWKDETKTLSSRVPVAYLDKNMVRYPISTFDPANADYGHLGLAQANDSFASLPRPYANLSMRLSKEFKKRIRFSLNAYNVLNIQPRYYDDSTNQLYVFNEPISVGAELSFKF